MKILSIEINCLRGIKNLKLNLEGKNAIIYGDNGTGKSGVIDAIDFLLSGEISRINGVGTGGINLQSHGKHVKSTPEDAWVSAVVKLPNTDKKLTIKRTLINHLTLECDEEYKQYFQNIEKIAKLQAHFLSRREITKYISSTDSNRAKDIESLLNLNDLMINRKVLQKISKDTQSDVETKTRELQSITQEIDKILLTSQEDWLNVINEKRNNLNCKSIETLDPNLITQGIDFSKESSIKTELSNQLKIVEDIIEELYGDYGLISNIDNLMLIQKSILELEQADMIIENLELYNNAVTCIKNDICPVCEQPIESKDKLITELKSKIEKLKSLSNLSTKRSFCHGKIKTNISNILRFYNNSYCKIKGYDTDSNLSNLKPLFEYINNLSIKDFKEENCLEYKNKINIKELLETIKTLIMSEVAKISIEKIQLEYKELTNVSSRLKIFIETKAELSKCQLLNTKAQILFKQYEVYQEEVLNDLYKTIENRFSFFYKLLHSKDEKDFNADFIKHGSGLEMSVQFLDGKKYPPNAVHSEGHQDSMGICLFFALSELIENEKLDVILLDDVVMSIDMDHRKSFCKLINEVFPNKQFIITTHDFIWRKELEIHNVSIPDNIFHFRSWSIDNGPLYEKNTDTWTIIKANLNEGNKSEAVGKLRYLLEEHFNYICQKYKLLVPYSPDGKWTLESVISPAHKFLKKTLTSALDSLQSYQKDTTQIQELLDKYNNSFSFFDHERWTLNPSTHFTPWAQELSITELKELIEAAENYCNIFKCNTCNKDFIINTDFNSTPQSIICPCATISFSCIRKK